MTLNLSIISADLTDVYGYSIASGSLEHGAKTRTNAPFNRKLRFPVIYNGEMRPKNDRLYLAKAGSIPGNIDLSMRPSFLCIGSPDSEFSEWLCDMAILSEEPGINDLLAETLEIFDKYAAWETALQNAIIKNQNIKTLGILSEPIFENPLCFCDKNYKCVFSVADKNKYALPDNYLTTNDNEYLSIEQIKLIEVEPDHADLYKKKSPLLISSKILGYRSLCHNIFIEEKLIGALFLAEINRKITSRDFSLIVVLADAITSMILKTESPALGRPRSLEETLKKMLARKTVNSEQLGEVLAEMNWNMRDTYVCVMFESAINEQDYSSMTTLSLKLAELTKTECYLAQKNTAFFVFNLTEGSREKHALIKTLLSVAKSSAVKIGISNSFSDFNALYHYYRQTMTAIKQGREKAPSRQCYYFDDYILDSILQNSHKDTVPEALYPEGLLALEQYDKLKGTTYMDTLSAYLECNMNIAETIRKVYMHRNTFLYQIGKIKEILGMNLDDGDTRLLLRIILKIRK